MNDVRDMDAAEAAAEAHKPGPWEAVPGAAYWHIRRVHDAELGITENVAAADSEGDARLIAAAPDLLAALEAVASHWADHDLLYEHELVLAKQAEAAIAAARGTAPNPEPEAGPCETCGYPRHECTCYSR